MAVSVSGLFTFLALLLAGPLYYGGLKYYRKRNGIEEEKREEPSSSSGDRETLDTMEYLFALIGYAIGIGNMWRFPYVIAQNGGAAAVLAYIISTVLVATPLFLYEMIIGQNLRLSTIPCYEKIKPRWESLGIASGCMLFMIMSYYGVVIAYTIPYIYNSMITPLPWIATGAETFWTKNILNQYDDPDTGDLGSVKADLALSLFLFWLIVLLTVGFGREVLAKITYVTVLLPVGLVIIMVIRTAFLDGAGDGVMFYIGRFEYEHLWNVKTWAAACGQTLFSMSPGLGTVLTYSSYAKPKEDVYRACIIVSVSNAAFSILGAFATFALVGHMAKQEGVDVEDLATRSGSGLAFITLAEAMQYFGAAENAMSILFFVTLFLLGLDSAYAMEQTITSYAVDIFEEQGWGKYPRWKMSAATCFVSACIGLIYTTRNGNHLLEIFDHFIGSVSLLYVAFMESLMLIFDYTFKRLDFALAKATYNNPATPEGRRLTPSWLCKMDFYVTVPAMSGCLVFYLIIRDMIDGFGDYPTYLNAWGWGMFVFLFVVSLGTIWKKDPTSLEPFDEEDIKISEPAPKNSGGASNPSIQLSGVV